MGLINLQTDLKSLKYGRDRKGGGDSGQPYIKKDIPSKSDELDNALKYGTGGPDFLLRGGLLTPSHILDDTIRLGRYFVDVKSPRGLLFIASQNLLSRTAVKTEASYGAAYGGGVAVSSSADTNVVGTGPVNEGIYLPTSTLLQAAGLPFGLHLNKQGIDPTGLIPGVSIKKYYDVVSEQFNANFKVNRLYKLFNNKISLKQSGDPYLYSYSGGPESTLGIGKTNLKIVDGRQRTGKNNIHGDEIIEKTYLAGLSNIKTNRSDIIFNGNNLLGASNKFTSATINDIRPINFTNGFSPAGQQLKYYGPQDNNSTLSIDKKEDNLKTYQAKQVSTVFLQDVEKNKKTGAKQINPDILRTGVSSKYSSIKEVSPLSLLNYDQLNRTQNNSVYKVYDNGESRLQPKPDISSSIQKSLVTLDSSNPPIKHTLQGQVNRSILSTGASSKYNSLKANNRVTSSLPSYNDAYQKGTLEPNFGAGVLVQEQKSVIDVNARVEQNINELDAPQDGGSTRNKFNARYGTLSIRTEEEKTVVDENSDSTPFYITVVSNEGFNLNQVLFFPAYITSFDDGIDAEWNAERFMGRGEEFFTYNGFKRSINLGFQIYPNNEAELIQMYNQLNTLASALTPDYSTNGFMRGSLFKLTLGNYVTDLPGIIRSIKFSVIDNDKITWDIDSLVPKYIEVKSFEFTPIHNFLPRKGQNFFGRPLYGDINPFPQPINNP